MITNLAKSGFEFTCLKNNDQTEDLGIESPHKKGFSLNAKKADIYLD